MKDAVVKVDLDLLRKIEKFVKDNKFHYSSNKQVVDLAIIEFLKTHELSKMGKK